MKTFRFVSLLILLAVLSTSAMAQDYRLWENENGDLSGLEFSRIHRLEAKRALATNSDGYYAVVWHDSRNGDFDVWMQVFDTQGTPQWGDGDLANSGVLVCGEVSFQGNSQVVALDDGSWMVVWEDARNNLTHYNRSDIYCQQISAEGVPVYPSGGVPVCVDGVPGVDGGESQGAIRAIGSINENGETNGVIVTWVDYRNNSSDIYAQLIGLQGDRLWQDD